MKAAVVCMLSLLLLSGCGAGLPHARELGGMSLMRTMGVDFDEDRAISVTVTTAHRDEDTSGKEKPVILSAKRETLSGACRALRSKDEESVFLGHIEELVLGENIAAQGGVEEILRYLADDSQLGLGLRVWLVREENAQTVLGNKDTENSSRHLGQLPVGSDLGIPGMERNAGAVLTDLLEGRAAWIPALTLTGEGEERSVLVWGYGVLDQDGLCGWITGDAARGLELACGYPGSELLELEQGTVRLRSVTLDCIPVLEGETVTGLRLDLRLTGQVEELLGGDTSKLQMQVEERTLRYVRAAVEQAQRENRDFLGLNMLAGLSAPEVCDQIRVQWPERFAELEIDIQCKATMVERRK